MERELHNLLNHHGDRSTSWITSYPHFESFDFDGGTIRFHPASKTLVAAAEPLIDRAQRASMLLKFSEHANNIRKHSIALPISQSFATELSRIGYHVFPVGVEPVYNLTDYFSGEDPLRRFNIARSLQLKGATVDTRKFSECTTEDIAQMKALFEEWKSDKGDTAMGFLSAVDPFKCTTQKTYYLLRHRGKIEAYLTSLPVQPQNAAYFADWIRPAKIKAGAMELLLIEAMRSLKNAGVKSARMGICACAGLEKSDFNKPGQRLLGGALRGIYKLGNYPYSLQGLYNFKAKLGPTSWEKLYAATDRKPGLWILNTLFETHFKKTITEHLLTKLRSLFTHAIAPKTAPKTFVELLKRTAFTTSTTAFMTALHLVRMKTEFGLKFYAESGFIGKGFTWFGYLTGPILHDNNYHAFGDLLTYAIMGGVVEIFFGARIFLLLTALGFWATNPAVTSTLGQFIPSVLLERDYGSSNAIFAFGGALAAASHRPVWILLPLVVNGLFVCIGKNSWLASHHWVGLALGYFVIRALTLKSARKN